MYGITNSGSGSGGGFSVNAAVLHVTAPFGSTVSISKGGVIAKTIGPGKAHTNADDENADYYFSITPTNYGTWTVTATLNSDSASDTVAISSNKQYDVELSYRLYLYNRGTQNVPWTKMTRDSTDVTFNTDNMYVQGYANYSGVIARTASTYDLTNFKTLYCVAKLNGTNGQIYLGAGTKLDLYDSKTQDSKVQITEINETTYSLDVSQMTTGNYVTIQGSGNAYVYEVYVVK